MTEYIELAFDEIKAETEKAILFDFGDNEVWVPRSILDPDEVVIDNAVFVAEWFALKEGLI